MRLQNGSWQCAYCGAELDIPDRNKVREMLVGTQGEPNVRVLLIDGIELHRCEVKAPMAGRSI